jgi:hypothetical protein
MKNKIKYKLYLNIPHKLCKCKNKNKGQINKYLMNKNQ